jgi:hypothetical protein
VWRRFDLISNSISGDKLSHFFLTKKTNKILVAVDKSRDEIHKLPRKYPATTTAVEHNKDDCIVDTAIEVSFSS